MPRDLSKTHVVTMSNRTNTGLFYEPDIKLMSLFLVFVDMYKHEIFLTSKSNV